MRYINLHFTDLLIQIANSGPLTLTLTLTLTWIGSYGTTSRIQTSMSVYIPYFVEIGKKLFCGRTDYLKLISFINPFLHSLSSFRTAFTDLEPVPN